MDRIRKAVIPAAGLGRRFYPLTRAQPKEMLPILDRPVIHYVVEEAVRSRLDEILIIVGYGKDSIINYFDRHRLDDQFDESGIDDFPDIYFVRQKEQRGLGDAILYAEHFTGDDDFAVLLGDTFYRSFDDRPVTESIVSLSMRLKNPVIAYDVVERSQVGSYGIIDGERISDEVYRIRSVVEKPKPGTEPSNMGITGLYVLGKFIYAYLHNIKPGKNNEIQLTDALNLAAAENEIYAARINGKRYDIGNKDLWIRIFMEFAREKGYW